MVERKKKFREIYDRIMQRNTQQSYAKNERKKERKKRLRNGSVVYEEKIC